MKLFVGHIFSASISRSNLIRLITLVVVFTVAINLKLLSILVNTEAFSSILDTSDARDYQFDEYCEKFGEWEALSRHYFFKRAANFYFVDTCLLRLNFIADHTITQSRFSLELIVEYANRTASSARLTTSIELRIQAMVHEYNLMQMDVFFNLTTFLQEQNLAAGKTEISLPVELDKLKISVHVAEFFMNATTKSSMDVNVKRLNRNNDDKSVKKTALVCAKCFRLNRTIHNTRLLKWWLDLNRRIGYDNVVLCNHSIEVDSRFLADYKDFLVLTRVIYISFLFSFCVNNFFFF
jgi:hypothetical protein